MDKKKFGRKDVRLIVKSVTQKNVTSAEVYYYYAWYVFLRNRR